MLLYYLEILPLIIHFLATSSCQVQRREPKYYHFYNCNVIRNIWFYIIPCNWIKISWGGRTPQDLPGNPGILSIKGLGYIAVVGHPRTSLGILGY